MTIQSHNTRFLNSFLYLFSKIVLVPRKRLRGSDGGHNCIITCRLLICKLDGQHYFMLICSFKLHTRALAVLIIIDTDKQNVIITKLPFEIASVKISVKLFIYTVFFIATLINKLSLSQLYQADDIILVAFL